MLNPTNLGLPENTNGVPYATALVLLHMFVASVILGISVWESQQEGKMRSFAELYSATDTPSERSPGLTALS